MIVWMINHYAIPPSEKGGTRHFNLAKQLIKAGHEVYIFASDFSHVSLKYISGLHSTRNNVQYIESVPFVWIHTNGYKGNTAARLFNILSFALRLNFNKFHSRLPKPDVVIGSSPHPFAAFVACRLAKKYTAPFVY